jgi:hypothetical protein
LFAEQAGDPTRMRSVVNDAFLADLAAGVGWSSRRSCWRCAPFVFAQAQAAKERNSEMLTEDNGEREGK